MPRIELLEIDDHILDKIEGRHGVAFQEVAEACYSEQRHVRRGREALHQVFSQTDGGRYVLVVLIDLGDGAWKVVTARAMTQSERRLYRRARGD